jgi:hypothetical protein
VRLLLDFRSDPNVLIPPPPAQAALDTKAKDRYRNVPRSLLATAIFCGFPQIAARLIDAGADRHPRDSLPPLIAALNDAKRDSLSVLLDGQPGDILSEIDGKSYLVHAIEAESGLLPLIAKLAVEELKKQKREKDIWRNLKAKQKRALTNALEIQDASMTAEYMRSIVNRTRTPWSPTREAETARQAAWDEPLPVEDASELPEAPPEPQPQAEPQAGAVQPVPEALPVDAPVQGNRVLVPA